MDFEWKRRKPVFRCFGVSGFRGFGTSVGEFNRQVAKDAKVEREARILDYEF
jgi:hypothetical protein